MLLYLKFMDKLMGLVLSYNSRRLKCLLTSLVQKPWEAFYSRTIYETIDIFIIM